MYFSISSPSEFISFNYPRGINLCREPWKWFSFFSCARSIVHACQPKITSPSCYNPAHCFLLWSRRKDGSHFNILLFHLSRLLINPWLVLNSSIIRTASVPVLLVMIFWRKTHATDEQGRAEQLVSLPVCQESEFAWGETLLLVSGNGAKGVDCMRLLQLLNGSIARAWLWK